ncbi:hypothetical protein HEQ69_10915 [Haematospirillum jordaniae]|uniref:hypothetical protein n=1 Tax=Haematospirillum jordaniae TaxID=1549855 RepID=UPI0014333440|nr:hypothetical protein [Haematospirillum jordaniae]NKD46214.1 hypothetical protein [Haematospirillum jordaniae]
MALPPKKQPVFPFVPPELVAELSRRYPDQAPDPEERLEDIMYRAGQVSLVRFLRRHMDQQTDKKGLI